MIEFIFLFSLGFVWILYATFSDIKTREIPNWLNFSLIIFALGFRFFYSLFFSGDFSLLYQGLIGLGIFFFLAKVLYYGRMFAGGDEKLMTSLGAVLPVFPVFSSNLNVFLAFFLLFFFAGAVYGVIGSAVISIKNRSVFKRGFKKLFIENKRITIISLFLGVISLLAGFFISPLIYLGIFLFVFPYFYLFIKTVDEFCMVKEVSVSKITPGDWLYKDVKVGGRTIKATWDGLSEEEIKILKRNKKKVMLKYGIVFTPVFLISFVLLWILLKFGILERFFFGVF